ncbi:hypothetical protein [Pseudodesulfovibrio sp.]|uniref:hypothetical protein n=1 Tax=unclassified Pseudodesulfovibrio TaxID=2661612 RepID=UPI003AFFA445
MSQLVSIAQKILTDCESLDDEKHKKLVIIVNNCNIFVDIGTRLNVKLDNASKDILERIIDEFFLDMHVACVLAAGGQFKSASVVARAALELGLYYIYFVDHRVELGAWANAANQDHKHDMSFSDVRELICTADYMAIASEGVGATDSISEINRLLQKSYRELSERVHGKYKFLYAANAGDPVNVDAFSRLADNFTTSLVRLLRMRVECYPDILEEVPQLEKIDE